MVSCACYIGTLAVRVKPKAEEPFTMATEERVRRLHRLACDLIDEVDECPGGYCEDGCYIHPRVVTLLDAAIESFKPESEPSNVR